MSVATRRQLNCQSLDEVAAEAQRLLTSGYKATGNWNLSQVCQHCSQWMRYPMDGFPKPAFPVAIILWVMKKTIGQRQRKKILASNSMPAGTPTLKQTKFQPDEKTDHEAVQDLLSTIERFKRHHGEFMASPLFGEMDRQQWNQLQLIHCSHHLSFLVPQDLEPA
jgi:hypothetical protein